MVNRIFNVLTVFVKLTLLTAFLSACAGEKNTDVNFAFGGAKSDNTNLTGDFDETIEAAVNAADLSLIGLEQQLTFAKYTVKRAQSQTDLFWLWFGTNDFVGGQTDPSYVATGIVNAMNFLRDEFGAKHFVVPNLLPLGDLPVIRVVGPEATAGMNQLTAAANGILAGALATYEENNKGSTVTLVDVSGVFGGLVNNPDFVNTTEPCTTAGLPNGADCDTWVYFDDFHFSSPVATLIAEEAAEQLTATHGEGINRFNRIITFGDSLSDTGMFFDTMVQATGTGFPGEPFYQGRFSNGPNVIDQLEEQLDLGVRSKAFSQLTGAELEALKNGQQ